jgi:hypothetical protein
MGNPLTHAQAEYVRTLLGYRVGRFQAARQQKDAGASAIELAIITAVIVAAAVVVLIIVNTIIRNRATEIQTNNNGIP